MESLTLGLSSIWQQLLRGEALLRGGHAVVLVFVAAVRAVQDPVAPFAVAMDAESVAAPVFTITRCSHKGAFTTAD